MKKLTFYAFAINVLIGIAAAYIWLINLIGPYGGVFLGFVYTSLVVLGANSFSDEGKREHG